MMSHIVQMPIFGSDLPGYVKDHKHRDALRELERIVLRKKKTPPKRGSDKKNKTTSDQSSPSESDAEKSENKQPKYGRFRNINNFSKITGSVRACYKVETVRPNELLFRPN